MKSTTLGLSLALLFSLSVLVGCNNEPAPVDTNEPGVSDDSDDTTTDDTTTDDTADTDTSDVTPTDDASSEIEIPELPAMGEAFPGTTSGDSDFEIPALDEAPAGTTAG